MAILQSQGDFSLIKITPAHLEMLSQLLPPTAAKSGGQTRAFIIGGEALFNKTLAFWRAYAPDTRLINEYGPTETVVGCCVYDASAQDRPTEEVPIGRPIANTQLFILDRSLQPVPVGVYGELYIGGDGVARGYMNMPDLTAERFIPNPFGTASRLYKTGDAARYLRDGNIEFRGRQDEQVKIRGFRIEPGEIEALLTEHRAVREALVIARQMQHEDDKSLVAYVVPHSHFAAETAPKEEFQTSQVEAWELVFQDSYSHPTHADDPTFDITGWNSSYTGEAIYAY